MPQQLYIFIAAQSLIILYEHGIGYYREGNDEN